ncbi:hypothetical protein GOP47_0028900 [Adiantum capillus-veneris]|nr:hypothetical protein GOP47_0028900 [Adiantum capillus-veneris]
MSEEEWTRKLDAMFPGYVEARYEEKLLQVTEGDAGHTLLEGEWLACEPYLTDGYGTREGIEEEHQVVPADSYPPHERGELEHAACSDLQAAAFELPEKRIVEICDNNPIVCEEVEGDAVNLGYGRLVLTLACEVITEDASRVRVVIETRDSAKYMLTMMHSDWVTTWVREIRLGMYPKWPYRLNASEERAEVKPAGSAIAGRLFGFKEQVPVRTPRHGAEDGRASQLAYTSPSMRGQLVKSARSITVGNVNLMDGPDGPEIT